MVNWDISRGDVIMCDLGIRDGSVQSGIRPCVVVSNDVGNTYSNIYIVVPLTTKHKTNLPTHVELTTDSYALCEQCTTISGQQILRKKSKIENDKMENINQALKVALSLY